MPIGIVCPSNYQQDCLFFSVVYFALAKENMNRRYGGKILHVKFKSSLSKPLGIQPVVEREDLLKKTLSISKEYLGVLGNSATVFSLWQGLENSKKIVSRRDTLMVVKYDPSNLARKQIWSKCLLI